MRRLPAETRKALSSRVRPEVAEPLAGDIRGAYRGPWARVLSAGTKTRASADPQIVVGGARRVVTGGASVRQLVYGNEWGGGKRVSIVNRELRKGRRRKGRVSAAEAARQASAGRVVYRRQTTRQFRTPRPSVFPTIRRAMPKILDRFANIVEETIDANL